MAKTKTAVTLGSAVVALALVTTACSSSGNTAQTATPTTTAPVTTTAPTTTTPPASSSSSMSMSDSGTSSTGSTVASNSPAANLRATLDELFREHVDLTGFVVNTALISGISSKQTSAALDALDQNTQDLGSAIKSFYGSSAQTKFLKLWRAHIGYFVDYTKGLAMKNTKLVSQAQKNLASYRTQFSNFIGPATGLPASAISTDLAGHVETLEAAIKAMVNKSDDASSKLAMAAEHMDGTAQVLASGIAKQQKLAGDADGAASTLRAGLTGLLIQHVAQTLQVVQTAVETSLTSPQLKAAESALDDNTVALGEAIKSEFGTAAQTAFLKMWRAHIGYFVNYTVGLATNKPAMVKKAQSQLAGYKSDFAKFVNSATDLPASAVADDLQGHIQTLETAIKAVLTKSPDAAKDAAAAMSHMAGTAQVLAQGIATVKKLS